MISAPPFVPLLRNPHLSTVLGNFWPRKVDERRFPAVIRKYQTDPTTVIVVYEHQPVDLPKGQIVLLHGLEGSAQAGYIQSFAQYALTRGFGVHRANLRTCGGTEHLCETMYHSGLTHDTHVILKLLRQQRNSPLFLVGFSLGGNVALKLAGELKDTDLLSGVCAISTPLDLASCVKRLASRSNLLYSRRFLKKLRERIVRKSTLAPHLYATEGLQNVKTVWEFDDHYTAKIFGFQTASNYYETQSAKRFLDLIHIPTLAITAQDDPLVPVEMYSHPAFSSNPALKLIVTQFGGHLGFISKHSPRFWLDRVCVDWIEGILSRILEEPNLRAS